MNPNLSSANKWKAINTAGTTVIPGKLILVGVVINTKGGSSNIAKIYDGTISNESLVATVDTVNNIGLISYYIPCLSGINIVTSAGTQADLTVIYAETP